MGNPSPDAQRCAKNHREKGRCAFLHAQNFDLTQRGIESTLRRPTRFNYCCREKLPAEHRTGLAQTFQACDADLLLINPPHFDYQIVQSIHPFASSRALREQSFPWVVSTAPIF